MKLILPILTILLISAYAQKTVKTPTQIKDEVDVDARIKKMYGRVGIEYFAGKKDRISSCGKTGAPDGGQCYWFFLDPTDGDRDSVTNQNQHQDRARIEVRFSGAPNAIKNGETYTHEWYFWVNKDAVITPNFFHIHQI